MMNGVVYFFRFIKNNIGKIFLVLSFTVLFIFVLFPFGDLNDYVSIQVSKLTQNKVFLQFDDMSVNPLTATLSLQKVFIETPEISTLKTNELSLRPSLTALLASKPGGTLKAEGFLKGDLEVHLSPKGERYKVEVSAQSLNLKEMKELLALSLPLNGQLNLAAQAEADLSFTEQPDGEITLTINKFEMPPSSLSLHDLGRLNLPEIKLSQIELKGKLANGKFQIESGKIGTNKDEFYGDIKGDVALTFQNLNGQLIPIYGAYNISLDLKATSAFKERAKFFLSFLDGYKKDLPDGTQYKFKIQASAVGVNPQFTPLQ